MELSIKINCGGEAHTYIQRLFTFYIQTHR